MSIFTTLYWWYDKNQFDRLSLKDPTKLSFIGTVYVSIDVRIMENPE